MSQSSPGSITPLPQRFSSIGDRSPHATHAPAKVNKSPAPRVMAFQSNKEIPELDTNSNCKSRYAPMA